MALKRSFEKPGLDNDLPEPVKLASPELPPGKPAARYQCKLCSHQGPEQHFCPDCLADTMRLLEADPEKA